MRRVDTSLALGVTTSFTASGEVVRAGLGAVDREPKIGDVIAGRYEVRELLGHGGCGYVYAVYDRELDVDVALKTLRPDVPIAPESVAQLKREIQLARKVTHANVCRIFDVGFHDDGGGRNTAFLTMEKIAGRSLGDRLERDGPLPPDQLEPLARQLIAGLEAAHRAGVIHADLKPANVMLAERDGEVRAVITDFGLATAHSIDLDREAYVLGTPAYMAPEQVASEPLSPATDYYALGCTLYHAGTGDVPFREATAFATALARLDRDPGPAGIDRRWDEIIAGLLRRAPGERLDGAAIESMLAPPRRTRRIAAIAAVLAIAAVVFGVAYGRSSRTGPPPSFALSLPENPVAAAELELGETMLETGASSRAVELLERALARTEHPRIHAALYRAHARLASTDARGHADRAAALAPPGPERRYYRALALLAHAKIADATAILTELAVRFPDSFDVGYDLGVAQSRARSFDLARATYARLIPRDAPERLAVLRARSEMEIEARAFPEGLRLTRELAAGAREGGYPLLESRALALMSRSQRQLGDLEGATESGARGLELARQVGDPWQIAESESSLVALLMQRHRYAAALAHLDGREAALAALGLTASITQNGVTRAEVLADTGRTGEALALLDERVVPELRRLHNVYWEGYSVLVRAQIRRSRAEYPEALSDCRAGLGMFRGIHNDRLAAFAQTVCATALIDTGALDEAAAALDEAEEIRGRFGLEHLVFQNRIDRGELALARGDLDAAREAALGAADYFAEHSMRNDEASARELAARAAWRAGDAATAGAQIALARRGLEGDGAQLARAVAITGQLIDGGPGADAAIRGQIAALREGGYTALAIEAELARAGLAGRRGDEALAEARARGMKPFRYRGKP